MPKVKIPRKSTAVDMTAMCDVAFLLLSFFILATKQKPPEVLAVQVPSSVSPKVAPDKAILITLTKDGRTFLMLGEDVKKKEILENINLTKSLGLTPAELAKWGKQTYIGTSFNLVKGTLALAQEMPADRAPGIPTDSANNEMIDWIRSVTNVFGAAQIEQRELEKILLVKGDAEVLYPKFRSIKEAFKKNEIYKFQIVTNGTPAPLGSELYDINKKAGAIK
jgi:biopolymer transport protein ExbD